MAQIIGMFCFKTHSVDTQYLSPNKLNLLISLQNIFRDKIFYIVFILLYILLYYIFMTMLAVEQWESIKTAKGMYLIPPNDLHVHAQYKQTGAHS